MSNINEIKKLYCLLGMLWKLKVIEIRLYGLDSWININVKKIKNLLRHLVNTVLPRKTPIENIDKTKPIYTLQTKNVINWNSHSLSEKRFQKFSRN